RGRAALALAGEEARRPFDLAASTGGPLLRGVLLRRAGEDHHLALNLHHIAGDGRSVGVLIRELTATSAVFAQRLPSPLAAPPGRSSWGAMPDSTICSWARRSPVATGGKSRA